MKDKDMPLAIKLTIKHRGYKGIVVQDISTEHCPMNFQDTLIMSFGLSFAVGEPTMHLIQIKDSLTPPKHFAEVVARKAIRDGVYMTSRTEFGTRVGRDLWTEYFTLARRKDNGEDLTAFMHMSSKRRLALNMSAVTALCFSPEDRVRATEASWESYRNGMGERSESGDSLPPWDVMPLRMRLNWAAAVKQTQKMYPHKKTK